MKLRNLSLIASLVLAGMSASAVHADTAMSTKTTSPQEVTNIVLVHGLFADASSWSKVIPLLQAKGLHVTAVQNPTTSLDNDVAAVKRALALQNGPVTHYESRPRTWLLSVHEHLKENRAHDAPFFYISICSP